MQKKQMLTTRYWLAESVDANEITICRPADKRISEGSDGWSLYHEKDKRVVCSMEYCHRSTRATFRIDKVAMAEYRISSAEVEDHIKD